MHRFISRACPPCVHCMHLPSGKKVAWPLGPELAALGGRPRPGDGPRPRPEARPPSRPRKTGELTPKFGAIRPRSSAGARPVFAGARKSCQTPIAEGLFCPPGAPEPLDNGTFRKVVGLPWLLVEKIRVPDASWVESGAGEMAVTLAWPSFDTIEAGLAE